VLNPLAGPPTKQHPAKIPGLRIESAGLGIEARALIEIKESDR
jgi:hypothetical protein